LMEKQLRTVIPKSVNIKVLEEANDTYYIVLPVSGTEGVELSDVDLEKVAGGGTVKGNQIAASALETVEFGGVATSQASETSGSSSKQIALVEEVIVPPPARYAYVRAFQESPAGDRGDELTPEQPFRVNQWYQLDVAVAVSPVGVAASKGRSAFRE